MGVGAFLERIRMTFYSTPSEDREFQAVRRTMVLPEGTSVPEDGDAPAPSVPPAVDDGPHADTGRRGPAPPAPSEDEDTSTSEMPSVPAPPQIPARSDREPGRAERERADVANLAVEGVRDATRYGLTIPFMRWLLSYKGGLSAEDFAIRTKEDLARAETERLAREPRSDAETPDMDGEGTPGPDDAPADTEPEPPAEAGTEEDVLSIPESKEVGDDAAEREALVGQFGARTQMRDTYYPNLACFVELHVANMWPYQQGVMTKFLWVPDWWRYPPLIYQLDALWRAYENARRQPGQMMIFNIQAFGLLDRVLNKDTGLVASLGIDENEHTTGPNEPLPCIRPPKGWRRKAMEPLRPARPMQTEETMSAMDAERTPHRMPERRPAMRTADANGNRQEGEP